MFNQFDQASADNGSFTTLEWILQILVSAIELFGSRILNSLS
jgi:hypothetical protein